MASKAAEEEGSNVLSLFIVSNKRMVALPFLSSGDLGRFSSFLRAHGGENISKAPSPRELKEIKAKYS